MDEDDSSMNTDGIRDLLAECDNLTYIYGNSKSKIEAVNYPVPESIEWDILLLASDDMIPQVQGYDDIIREEMVRLYPDMDGVLFHYDGYQDKNVNTLSILGKKYFTRFNYIYNPVYLTWWSDTEFTEVAWMLNRQTYFEQVIIRHEHPDNGVGKYDSLYKKNAIAGIDNPIYHKRLERNFFLKKVLIIQPGRYGDIIICLPIAKYFHDQNCVVEWLCPEEYHTLFKNIDYVTPTLGTQGGKVGWDVTKFSNAGYNCNLYDVVIDLSFGFGGKPQDWWNFNKELFDSFVTAKYYLAGIPLFHRWNLVWKRNEVKEMALYYLITEEYGNEYILVHEESHTGKYIDHPDKNKVVFKPTDNFNVFDWYEVIAHAKEIHCIDSSLANFIEVVPEFRDIEKAIYLSAREPNKYLRSIYRNGWTII